MRGWKPELNERNEPSCYHGLLTEGLAGGHMNILDVNTLVVAASREGGMAETTKKQEHSDEVMALFAARRHETDAEARKQLSKRLWKALRAQRRLRQDREICELADRGQGLRSLQRVQQRHSGIGRTGEVKNMTGEVVSDSACVAEAFAQFYEDL